MLGGLESLAPEVAESARPRSVSASWPTVNWQRWEKTPPKTTKITPHKMLFFIFATTCLSQNLFHHVCWLDTSEPLVEPAKLERESLVIDSQLMQDGGVEIANMHRIFGDVV